MYLAKMINLQLQLQLQLQIQLQRQPQQVLSAHQEVVDLQGLKVNQQTDLQLTQKAPLEGQSGFQEGRTDPQG